MRVKVFKLRNSSFEFRRQPTMVWTWMFVYATITMPALIDTLLSNCLWNILNMLSNIWPDCPKFWKISLVQMSALLRGLSVRGEETLFGLKYENTKTIPYIAEERTSVVSIFWMRRPTFFWRLKEKLYCLFFHFSPLIREVKYISLKEFSARTWRFPSFANTCHSLFSSVWQHFQVEQSFNALGTYFSYNRFVIILRMKEEKLVDRPISVDFTCTPV